MINGVKKTMGRTLDGMMKTLPAAQRAAVERRASELVCRFKDRAAVRVKAGAGDAPRKRRTVRRRVAV